MLWRWMDRMTNRSNRVCVHGTSPNSLALQLETLEDRTVPASTAQLLRDLTPGVDGSFPMSFAELNTKLFFAADSQLYESNGLAVGTKKFDVPGRDLFAVSNLTRVGSTLYFTAGDYLPNGSTPMGNELWKTDGTGAGTVLVKDIFPGETGSDPSDFVVAGNKLFFRAKSPAQPNHDSLWVTDGTAAGTILVKDINPSGNDEVDFQSSRVYHGVNALGNLLIFTANDGGVNGTQLWRSDGTAAGTFKLTDQPFFPQGKMAEFFGKLYYGGVQAIHFTDGTLAGTGTTSYAGNFQYSRAFTNLGGLLGFIAEPFDTATQPYTLWAMTNGGTATQQVSLGVSDLWAYGDLVANGSQLFIIRDGFFSGNKTQIHFTNMTQAGTVLLKEFTPAAAPGSFNYITQSERAGLKVFFSLYNFEAGTSPNAYVEYWESDGSASGTVAVTNALTGGALRNTAGGEMRLINGAEMFFAAEAPTVGWEVFKVGNPVGPQPAPERSDIIARYGEAGQWYVGKSNGTSFTTSYFGTWSPGITWVDVQTGDFNGDQIDDIVGRWKEGGQWYVGLSNGTSFTTSLWAYWSPGVTWADVKVGDFNRDGRDDIVGRWAEGGQWYVGLSNGTSFATSFWAYWSPGVTWADVNVGDFDGDGKADIVGRWKEGGQWYVGKSNGTSFVTSFFAYWSPGVTWADVKILDLNRDGRKDIIGRWAESGQWYAGISTGAAFNTSYWGVWSVINWVDVSVGDFDDDGFPDIAGRWKETGQWYVSRSTGTNLQTSYFGAWSVGVTWADVKVGDFDGDGRDDLVGRYKEAGQWYVGRSTGTTFLNQLWATWSTGVTWADVAAADLD